MATVQVAMADPGPKADIPTNSKAQLNPPVGAAPPLSWMKNGVKWNPSPTPVHVDPTIGKDDVYEVADKAGTTSSAIVRWQPGAPAKAELMPGKGNASVTWPVSGDEQNFDYYEVD